MAYPPWSGNIVREEPARIAGRLIVFNQIFPALVANELENKWVLGKFVEYEFDSHMDSEWMVANLDGWEGYRPNYPQNSPYLRVTTKVLTDSGVWEEAETYVLNPNKPLPHLVDETEIPNGDYQEWRKTNWRR